MNALIEVLNHYRPFGNVSGAELRLPPRLAIHFADELAQIGMVNLGVDGWYYVPQSHGLAQDLAIDFFVGDAVLNSPNAAQESAKLVQDFIQGLPNHIVFVSFTLDYPLEWQADILNTLKIRPIEA